MGIKLVQGSFSNVGFRDGKPDAEVLSPTWFREDFGRKIHDCMKKYSAMQNLCTENAEFCDAL